MAQNNNEVWALFRSLSIILGVAITCAVCIGAIMHSWLAAFAMLILTIVAQFAINTIVMGISDRKNKEAEFLAQQVLREASERQMPYELNCAYCNVLNRVGISFNAENGFVCKGCNEPNKVYIQFSVVRVTTPLTQKENTEFIDIDGDPGVSQSTINQPIRVNEK